MSEVFLKRIMTETTETQRHGGKYFTIKEVFYSFKTLCLSVSVVNFLEGRTSES